MSDTWYDRTQGATLVAAENHRQPWDPTDIETVITFTDIDTDADIALALGRTLHAIQDIQWKLRREGPDAVREAYAPRVERPVPMCDAHHIALAANGTCDWC